MTSKPKTTKPKKTASKAKLTSKELQTTPKVPKKTGPKGPWKMTGEVVGKLEQAFAIDATVDEACFYAGIDKTTYYDWKKKFPELSHRMELLRNTPVLAARQTIANAVKNDPDLAMKFLERKRKKEYSTRAELTGADGEALPRPIMAHITVNEAEAKKIVDGEVVDPIQQLEEDIAYGE